MSRRRKGRVSPSIVTNESAAVLEAQNRSRELDLLEMALVESISPQQPKQPAAPQVIESGIVNGQHFVNRADFMPIDFGFNNLVGGGLATSMSDHDDGRLAPFILNDQDVTQARAMARYVTTVNCPAIGIGESLKNYVIGRGFVHTVGARKKYARRFDNLVDEAQEVLDEFDDDNAFKGDLDRELFWRSRRDGDAFLALYPTQSGRTRARVVEPELVCDPGSSPFSEEEYLALMKRYNQPVRIPLHLTNWSFGIHTAEADIVTRLGYHIRWDGEAYSDYIPEPFMVHLKANNDRNVKRGLTDFYPAWKWLVQQSEVLDNTAESAKKQSAIAFIVQHIAGVTKQKVETMKDAAADVTYNVMTAGGGSKAIRQTNRQPGTELNVPKGQEYLPGPTGHDRGNAFMDVVQGILRQISVRWQMSEGMISGDDSGNSYASSVTAGSRFHRFATSTQGEYIAYFKEIDWKVLRNAYNAGRFKKHGFGHGSEPFSKMRRILEISVEAPDVDERLSLDIAQERQILNGSGIMSRKTWREKAGLDHEVEEENIKAENKADAEAQGGGMPGMGMPGMEYPGDPSMEAPVGSGFPMPAEAEAPAPPVAPVTAAPQVPSPPGLEEMSALVNRLESAANRIMESQAAVMPHLDKRIKAAAKQTKRNPTEDEKDTGRYDQGTVVVKNLVISIENPKGSTRSGVAADGTKWKSKMTAHYGSVLGSPGFDGDPVDVFLGENPTSDVVYVIDQIKQDTGAFDEHKIMLGYTSKDEAIAGYLGNYQPGWRLGKVTPMWMDDFKQWLIVDHSKPMCKDPEYSDGRAGGVDVPKMPGTKAEPLAITVPSVVPVVVPQNPARSEAAVAAAAVAPVANSKVVEPQVDAIESSLFESSCGADTGTGGRGFGVGNTCGKGPMVHLQSVGKKPAVRAEEIKVGDTLMWNFGEKSEVVGILGETEKTILFNLRENGKDFERRMNKTRLVVKVEPKAGSPVADSDDLAQRKEEFKKFLMDNRDLLDDVEVEGIPKGKLKQASLFSDDEPSDAKVMLETPRSSFNPATTIAEAESYAVSAGLTKSADYKKISLEYANLVNEKLTDLVAEYGVPFDAIKAVARKTRTGAEVAMSVSDKYAAHTHMYDGTTLLINSGTATYIRDNAEKINKYYNTNISEDDSELVVLEKWLGAQPGWQAVPTNAGNLSHEYGHLLTASRGTIAQAKGRQATLRFFKDRSVSKYAGTHGIEALAEIFSAYDNDPDSVTDEQIAFFNRYSMKPIGGNRIKSEIRIPIFRDDLDDETGDVILLDDDGTLDWLLEEPGDVAEATAQWARYTGPRGGKGWKNLQSGYVAYQEESPGADGVKGISKDAAVSGTGKPTELGKEAKPVFDGDVSDYLAETFRVGKYALEPDLLEEAIDKKVSFRTSQEGGRNSSWRGVISFREKPSDRLLAAVLSQVGGHPTKVGDLEWEAASNTKVLHEHSAEWVRGLVDAGAWVKKTGLKNPKFDLHGDHAEKPTKQTDSPEFKAFFGKSKVVDENGQPLRVFHGTARPDRINDDFDAERATSGPMPFFTDDPEIASNYAVGKSDNSIDDEDYTKFYDVEGHGDLDAAWSKLSAQQRSALRENLKYVQVDSEVYDDNGNPLPDEIRLNKEDGGSVPNATIEHDARQYRGNYLKAAFDSFVQSGLMFQQENRFPEVLKVAAGISATYDDPNENKAGVFPVFLALENPLDTSAIPDKVRTALKKAAKSAPKPKYQYGEDQWDKNTSSPSEWIERLDDDRENGTNYVWTTIPDWVTSELTRLGYDGIKDQGGKYHDGEHTVWIPFREDQVKSATGNRGTFDRTKPKITESKSEPDDKIFKLLEVLKQERSAGQILEDYP